MNTQRTGIFRYLLIFALALVLIRFLPVIMRASQAIVIGLRGYWWATLPSLLFISWVIWRLKRRKLVTKESEYVLKTQPLRESDK